MSWGELAGPGRSGTASRPGRCGEARGRSPGHADLPDRGRCGGVAEPDQLPLHPPVPPHGIIGRDANHQLADRSCRGRPPGTPAAGVVPLAYDQPPVPGEQRRRYHREHLASPAAGNQSRQCCQSQPVARLVTDPAGLTAQDRVLVPQHQRARRPWTPGAAPASSGSRANKSEQVHDRNDHSAMIPAGKSVQARPSNRAPQAEAAGPLQLRSGQFF